MQRSPKRRRPPTDSRRGSSPRAPHLGAFSKKDLLALISELQAQDKSGPALSIGGPSSDDAGSTESTAAPGPTPVRTPCLFIDQPVRSGQNIEFPDGDVTVIGSVGSGAEIVAGGSIHVYGALRGRALAGTAGDRTARILCRNFQAELVAIDGHYHVAENLDAGLRGRPVQARLDGSGMTLVPLD